MLHLLLAVSLLQVAWTDLRVAQQVPVTVNVSSSSEPDRKEAGEKVKKEMPILSDKGVAAAAQVWLLPMKCAVKGGCPDLEPLLKFGVDAALAAIPTVGPFLQGLVDLFWPENQQSVWDQVKDEVQKLVDDALREKENETVRSILQHLEHATKKHLEYSHCSPERHVKDDILTEAFDKLFTHFENAAGSSDLQPNPIIYLPQQSEKTTQARRLLWSILAYLPETSTLDLSVKLNILENSWQYDQTADVNKQNCEANLEDLKDTAQKYIDFYKKAVFDFEEGVGGSPTSDLKITPQVYESSCGQGNEAYPCQRPFTPNPRDPKLGLKITTDKNGAQWVRSNDYNNAFYTHWIAVAYRPLQQYLKLATDLEAKNYCQALQNRGIKCQSESMGAKSFLSTGGEVSAWRSSDQSQEATYGGRILCDPPPPCQHIGSNVTLI